MDITIAIPIAPEGKASARAAGHVYKAAKTRRYEAEVAAAVARLWPEGALMERGPVAVDYVFVLPRGRHAAASWAAVKPDWDNMVKAAQDALAKAHGGWDDARIVLGRGAKIRAEDGQTPRIIMRVYTAPPLPPWVTRMLAAGALPADGWTDV